jgi:hypothetical protein
LFVDLPQTHPVHNIAINHPVCSPVSLGVVSCGQRLLGCYLSQQRVCFISVIVVVMLEEKVISMSNLSVLA